MKKSPKQLYEYRITKAHEVYEDTRNKALRILKQLQERCKHSNTYFCDDASGGNDSYYECKNCGKVL